MRSTLAAHRTLASAPVLVPLLQVESQIQIGRLAFKDNSLLDDAALRKKAIRALLCYHPFWLCLGMETVLNRRMFHDPSAAEKGVTGDHDLEAVLREEFLSDSSLLVRSQVCHPCPLCLVSCFNKPQHFNHCARSLKVDAHVLMQGGASLIRCADKKKLLSELVIYRILCLVILLDRIPKHMQLPQEAPFIFRLAATLKSSEDVLNDCLQCSLAGIGKLSRHLSKASYAVDLKQRDVDEWKTDVVSLAADLSNGIVLCKLVTVLFGTVCLGPVYVRGL